MINSLLSWFRANKENYFFREKRSPYRIWVSEVGLQQTRIRAAIPILKDFLKKFPNISKLGTAREEDVVLAFRGLGYYNRARNLRKGARYILKECKGQFPKSYLEILKIPSIGPYTAAMISSISFGEKKPAIDGNIKRVLSRLFLINKPLDRSDFLTVVSRKLLSLLQSSNENPGDINEAFMELGQKICLRGNPLCLDGGSKKNPCPIFKFCDAFKKNRVKKFPVPGKKEIKIDLQWYLFIIYDSQKRILLERWSDFYFLKGHLGFPSILNFESEKKIINSWPNNSPAESSQRHKKPGSLSGYQLRPFSHAITKHRITLLPIYMPIEKFLEVYPDTRGAYKGDQNKNDFFWLSLEDAEKKIVPSLLQKAIKIVKVHLG